MWGDKWEGWDDLNKAERTLYFWGNKVGRIPGQMKEKFGELRWYAGIGGADSLHDLVKHGHVAFRWSPRGHFFMSWLNNVSKAYISPLSYLFYKYKCFMYGFAYYMACKKYPNVKDEILGCVDHVGLLFKGELKALNDADERYKAAQKLKKAANPDEYADEDE
jgi:hypothetical protein